MRSPNKKRNYVLLPCACRTHNQGNFIAEQIKAQEHLQDNFLNFNKLKSIYLKLSLYIHQIICRIDLITLVCGLAI
jgi:hypothetical protein